MEAEEISATDTAAPDTVDHNETEEHPDETGTTDVPEKAQSS